MNSSIIDKVAPKLKQPFESVGFLIYTLRENYGWNQTELAARVGCTASCVSSWESGRMLPQGKNIIRLADVFEMSVDEILMGMSCIVPAEMETPEQAELTNSILEDVTFAAPESDDKIEEARGTTYTGSDNPTFNLIFQSNRLVTVRIVKQCRVIDLAIADIPGLVIDAIAEAVRAEK